MGTEHSISSPQEIELIDDRILARYIKPKDRTDTGVLLPEVVVKSKEEAVQAGEVIAVGPGRFTGDGCHEKMMDIQPGDVVFFAKFMGWQLMIEEGGEEVEYRVFGQHDLLGIKRMGRETMNNEPTTEVQKTEIQRLADWILQILGWWKQERTAAKNGN